MINLQFTIPLQYVLLTNIIHLHRKGTCKEGKKIEGHVCLTNLYEKAKISSRARHADPTAKAVP